MTLHILAAHGLTPTKYRERFGIAQAQPLTAEKYSAIRRWIVARDRRPNTTEASGVSGPRPVRRSRLPHGTQEDIDLLLVLEEPKIGTHVLLLEVKADELERPRT